MKSISLAAAAIAIIALLAGCASLERYSGELDPRVRPVQKAYEDAVTPYLAKDEAYYGSVLTLQVAALPLNPVVRNAMVERLSAAFNYSAEEIAKARADMSAAIKEADEVVVSFYTPERAWNDLDGKKPDWQVFLVAEDDRKIKPMDVREISMEPARNLALYFFHGQWSKLYKLRFAPGQAGEKAVLWITGAPATVKLPLVLR